MHRDFNFSNSYYNNYPTNQPPAPRQDSFLHSPEAKKQGESQLQIFNGEQPIRDIYGLQQNSSKTSLAFVPQRVNKSPSQKGFPIIYNSYNDGTQPHVKMQYLTTNYSQKPMKSQYNQFQQLHESNQSSLNYRLPQYRPEEVHKSNELHTFQQIPQSQPNTAKFIQPSEKNLPEQYFMASQTEPYRPPSDIYFQQRQMYSSPPPAYHIQTHQPFPVIVPQSKVQSRIISKPNIPVPPSNRVVFQQPQQKFATNYLDDRQRLISIPQEEYERYQEHMAHCRKTQEQSVLAKTKIQQLSQKQRFYWQQNMTLRQENKRLRDLVNHFQKREKELLKQREEINQNFESQITKYRDSTLEQLALLLERYKLEIQKKK